MYDEKTPVLIVGGNMVGLAVSLFLSWQGVPSILVERHHQVLDHPRAAGLNPRSMEIFRSIGLEGAIRDSVEPTAQYADILQAESLTGKQLKWFEGPRADDRDGIGASGWALCGQNRLERLLMEHASILGADIRYGTEMLGVAQDEDGVTLRAITRETGRELIVRADYLIAADGNRSPVRESLGIARDGRGTIGYYLVILFQADLGAYRPERPFFICFVTNPTVRGALGELDPVRQQWSLAIPFTVEAGEPQPADYTEQQCRQLVQAAIGEPGAEVRITGRHSWQLAERCAVRLQDRRVFLVGDAAHVCPPTGGFSANLGIEDAYNLAWKLAHRLRDWAGTPLLDTYSAERRPVAEFTSNQAVLRYLRNNDLVGHGADKLAPDASVIYGPVYRSNAVVADGSADDTSAVQDPRVSRARPGSRMPWFPLRQGSQQISVHDLAGRHCLLLSGPDGQPWHQAAGEVAKRLGITLKSYRVGPSAELVDVYGGWRSHVGVSSSGALLVRPDGYVGWRASELTDTPAAALADALTRVLGRRTVAARSPGEN